MAYNITTTAGATLATVSDGTVNTSATSLTLIGKNYAGYGVFLNENYIKLLENFANTTEPSTPLTGQLWYDNTNKVLKVYDGTIWKPISGSASSSTQPTTPVTGDLWWDSTNTQLKVYNGSTWTLIGPLTTAGTGTSGPTVETVSDGVNPHVIVRFYVANTTVGILSKDASFSPSPSITGFATIKPGFNLAATNVVANAAFTGNASAAVALTSPSGLLTSSQFLRSDENETTAYTFGVINDTGLTVGGSSNFTVSVVSGAVRLTNTVTNSDLNMFVKYGGVDTRAIGINGTTLAVGVTGALTVGGAATVTGNLNVSSWSNLTNARISTLLIPSANNTIDIGTSSLKFANVHATNFVGTAIQANYADLAERFEADVPMVPGTVVELGGMKEITAAVQELSEAVFGVISTLPGFLLNGAAGTDATHPAVAVNGRVPVRVIGKIKKGDRLVSAGRGLARAASRNEITAFNVIGRALADKTTDAEGTVEAIVKLNS